MVTQSVQRSECVSCMACMNICPQKSISVSEDQKGFFYPIVDLNTCIQCGMCERVCPILTGNKLIPNAAIEPMVYAAWSKQNLDRRLSSSGGLFSVFARDFINYGGIVYGVMLSEYSEAVFARAANISDLEKLRGSKYVQVKVDLVYQKVKADLISGRKVLFSGSPCQVAALYSFLGENFDIENLYTIDIVCHGVPSPKVFKMYLQDLKNDFGKSAIRHVFFRDKQAGWDDFKLKVEFEDGFEYYGTKNRDPYLLAFLNDLIRKDSCKSCPYTSIHRESDITLGDFWKYHSQEKQFRNTDEGICCA